MAAVNRKLKVFLCHSKDDKSKVRDLYRRLVADGFDTWLDEEKLMPGQDWDLEIRKAVRESDVVVVCLSNSSTTKAGYVQKEIRFALDVADEQPEGAVFIIPTRFEDSQVPNRLNRWQWVNLFESSGYKRLKTSLEIRIEYLGINKSLYFELEPQLVRVPAGKFIMGTSKEQAEEAIKNGAEKRWVEWEQPQHSVELSDYFIGKYTIVNQQYQAFVQEMNYEPPEGWSGTQSPHDKSGHPVVNVSWNDSVAYCKWLSEKTKKIYRLPTEAEWEKAARGTDGLIWPWGNQFDKNRANTYESKFSDTTPVGAFSPEGDSPYGCADMIGNVWEWCLDWDNESEYKQLDGKILKNPVNLKAKRFRSLRGGSFHDGQRRARCASRGGGHPPDWSWDLGFRVVLSME